MNLNPVHQYNILGSKWLLCRIAFAISAYSRLFLLKFLFLCYSCRFYSKQKKRKIKIKMKKKADCFGESWTPCQCSYKHFTTVCDSFKQENIAIHFIWNQRLYFTLKLQRSTWKQKKTRTGWHWPRIGYYCQSTFIPLNIRNFSNQQKN